MNKSLLLSCLAALSLGVSARAVDDYQVTGSVSEVSETKIVVMKGKEKFEIARTPESKVSGDLRVGAKVTVHYTMTAKSVEVKAAK